MDISMDMSTDIHIYGKPGSFSSYSTGSEQQASPEIKQTSQ